MPDSPKRSISAELTLVAADGSPAPLGNFAGRFLVVQMLRYYG
jgi:hypothetical protein